MYSVTRRTRPDGTVGAAVCVFMRPKVISPGGGRRGGLGQRGPRHSRHHADRAQRRRDAAAIAGGRRGGVPREAGAQRRAASRRACGALHGVMHAVLRYGIAVAGVAVTVVVGLALRPFALAGPPLLLVAVLVAGLVGGLRPALVAWGLATLAF